MKYISLYLSFLLLLYAAGCKSPPAIHSEELSSAASGPGVEDDDTEQNPDASVNENVPPVVTLPDSDAELPVSSFSEIWGYLVEGREEAYNPDYPISDVCYFGTDLDSYGSLIDVPDFNKIAAFPGRKHLVATCNGRALTHFALREGSRERKALIHDLLKAAGPYDGLQIDFEYVLPKDGDIFISFLKDMRKGLGKKLLTVALPARTRTLADDVYDYAKITPIADRILVMAYDEHWSTSEPGPIASMDWCQRVARYALETIGSEKLIMGLPFYGRSWGNINTNRAYIYSGIEGLMEEQNITEIRRENGVPTFRYEMPLSVTVYYEDAYSLSVRLEMYRKLDVNQVGFWRLGQETPAFWSIIKLQQSDPSR